MASRDGIISPFFLLNFRADKRLKHISSFPFHTHTHISVHPLMTLKLITLIYKHSSLIYRTCLPDFFFQKCQVKGTGLPYISLVLFQSPAGSSSDGSMPLSISSPFLLSFFYPHCLFINSYYLSVLLQMDDSSYYIGSKLSVIIM